jgi:hypothetical protein
MGSTQDLESAMELFDNLEITLYNGTVVHIYGITDEDVLFWNKDKGLTSESLQRTTVSEFKVLADTAKF